MNRGVMRYIASCISVLSTLVIVGPAVAAELPPTPKRERPAPQRAERPAPQQTAQQSSNWNGGQVGGSNGASGVNNNFVEPGVYLFSGLRSSRQQLELREPGLRRDALLVQQQHQLAIHRRRLLWISAASRFRKGNWRRRLRGRHRRRCLLSERRNLFRSEWASSWFSSTGFETSPGRSSRVLTAPYARGRIGASATPWTLVYATGGLAIGEISGSFSYLACTTSQLERDAGGRNGRRRRGDRAFPGMEGQARIPLHRLRLDHQGPGAVEQRQRHVLADGLRQRCLHRDEGVHPPHHGRPRLRPLIRRYKPEEWDRTLASAYSRPFGNPTLTRCRRRDPSDIPMEGSGRTDDGRGLPYRRWGYAPKR
jgi:hypothetical protein